MKRIAGILCAVLTLALFGFLGAAWSDDAEESKSRAQSILSGAADYLAAQDALAFEAQIIYVGLVDGDEERLVTDYTVAFSRPDAITVHMVNYDLDIVLATSGDEYLRYVPEFKQFLVEAESLSPVEVIAQAGFQVIDSALALIGEMVSATPFSDATRTSNVSFVGEESVNDVACSRIQFTFDEAVYDVWIAQEGDPLVRRFKPDMTELEEQLGGEVGVEFKIDVTADFSAWESGPEIAQRARFSPPENAQLVTAFHAPSPADALRGETAPDFTVALLDGESFTLSESRGKIVILDFWATWCGPCRIAMPAIVEVAEALADKGVEFYGVNLREDPERVRTYLEGQGLKLNVAMDSDGAVGDLYKADGIPQTVVIGRDGVVKIVHVGLWAMPEESAATREEEMKLFHNALTSSLRAELEELIASEGASD